MKAAVHSMHMNDFPSLYHFLKKKYYITNWQAHELL